MPFGHNDSPDIQQRKTSQTPTDNETEIIMLMDSNSKFIEFRKLWTLAGTKIKRCGNINELTNIINEDIVYTNLKYILINVGVNDIDNQSGTDVFNRLKQTIHYIKNKFENVKIILSEITPRRDQRDEDVLMCNRLLNEYARSIEYLVIARHSNLRDTEGSFLYDAKHIKKTCIARFASNLKRALCIAYNIEFHGKRYYKDTNIINSKQGHSSHQNRSSESNSMFPTQLPNHQYNRTRDQVTRSVDSTEAKFEVFKNELKQKLIAIFD